MKNSFFPLLAEHAQRLLCSLQPIFSRHAKKVLVLMIICLTLSSICWVISWKAATSSKKKPLVAIQLPSAPLNQNASTVVNRLSLALSLQAQLKALSLQDSLSKADSLLIEETLAEINLQNQAHEKSKSQKP